MKKHLFLITCLLSMLFFSTPCYADSPLTSTDFHTAYMDLEIVQQATKLGSINLEIATYLSSKNNPIDIKAAVINALGWDIDGKNNAEMYSNLIYKKPIKEIDLELLSGEELFCIGYMTAMDDYFHPEKAIPLLDKATTKVPDSFTMSIISSIVKGQKASDNYDWNAVWETTNQVINDNKIDKELRTEASRIIIDYMSAYSDYPVINPFAYENKVFFYLQDPELMVNSNSYEIDFGRGTKPELRNGRTFLPISPLIMAMGGKVDWDGKESKVTIKLKLRTLELWIGKKTVIVDGVVKQLEVVPYTSNSRTMLPLRFITENLGYKVDWNGQINEIMITIPNSQYKATAEELWSVGNHLLTWGNYELADDYFSRAIELNANYADAYEGKAVVIVWIGDDRQALELCRKALSIDSRNASAYNAMAMAYRNLEMYDESLNSCIKAIELKPDFAEAHNHKGNALYFLGKYSEAIECYDFAINYDPTLFNAYNSKGNALYALGNYEESVKYYDKALEIDPFFADPYFNKGTSLYALGRFEEAVESFDEYIDLDSESAYAYYWKAGALVTLNKFDEALAELKVAFELNDELKSIAVNDEVFDVFWNNKTFLQLIE